MSLRSVWLVAITVSLSLRGLSPELIVALWVLVNNGSKPSFWASNWSVDESKLRDIILVNHVKNWLFLYFMCFLDRVIQFGQLFSSLYSRQRE